MKSVKYGLMHKATQEFMGVYNPSEYSRGTFSMNANRRFEEDNVRNIVAFLSAKKEGSSYSRYQWATGGHDPDEFVAVVFIRDENGFRKSEDIKQIDLPDVIRCSAKRARTYSATPQKLRDRYFGVEFQETVKGLDIEACIVVPEEGRSLKQGDFVYIDQADMVIGEVKMASDVPDEWPVDDTDYERKGWQFVLVERGTKTLEAKATLTDIEPLAQVPGL
jgi:hypothetical protein